MVETLVLRRFLDGAPTPVDAGAAVAALRRLAIDPAPDGVATLYAGDGGEAAVDVSALRTPEGLSEAQVDVASFSRGLADILHDLATAADLTVAAAPGHRVYLMDGAQARHLPPELAAAAHTCVDGAELWWWLERDARAPGTTPAGPEAPPHGRAVTRGDALRTLFGALRRD